MRMIDKETRQVYEVIDPNPVFLSGERYIRVRRGFTDLMAKIDDLTEIVTNEQQYDNEGKEQLNG